MLKTERVGDNHWRSTIEGTDRLNVTIAATIKEQLSEQLVNCGYNLVLDFQNIRFIDSTGIGVLISALKAARENNGNFQLANVNKEVFSLLSLMKLDKVFDFSK
ncbi:MAG: STAS domain-containing protein [Bacteroidota bacterium]|jgi:anti-sigma B factor antagonist|nr:STAS domain-containing protein [Bacteroidota bacterium]